MTRDRHTGLIGLCLVVLGCVALLTTAANGQTTRPGQFSNDPPSLAVSLPSPITENDLAWYVRVLQLAEPQVLFAREAYSRYLQEFEPARREKMAMLKSKAKEAGAARSPTITYAAAKLSTAVARSEQQYASELRKIDDRFIDAVAGICSDSQSANLPAVRWHRDRACCSPLGIAMPGARVDLSMIVQLLATSSDDLSGAMPTMREYEAALTPLRVSLNSAMYADREECDMLEAEISYASASGSPDAAANIHSFIAHYPRILARRADLQDKISQLNDRSIDVIAASLPDSVAADFRANAQAAVHTSVFPDPTSLERLLADMMQATGWTEDVKAAVMQLIDAYQKQYQSVCRQMCDAAMEWHSCFARTNSSATFASHVERMRSLRQDRWELATQLMAQLRLIWPEAVASAFAEQFQQVEARIAKLKKAGREDMYPPKR